MYSITPRWIKSDENFERMWREFHNAVIDLDSERARMRVYDFLEREVLGPLGYRYINKGDYIVAVPPNRPNYLCIFLYVGNYDSYTKHEIIRYAIDIALRESAVEGLSSLKGLSNTKIFIISRNIMYELVFFDDSLKWSALPLEDIHGDERLDSYAFSRLLSRLTMLAEKPLYP